MISVEAVKNALDFEAYYRSEVGELKPGTNGNHLGLCPFHEDIEPSLSVNFQNGLFKCFGCQARGDVFDFYRAKHGCDFKEALEELARIAGLNGDRPQAQKPRIVKTYDYVDPEGRLLFQVCRTQPKSFRQRRPDPQNPSKWVWNLRGVARVPYRLPELLQAGELAICEGERDCDALAALGVTATTCPGGAGKWRPEFNQLFQGKKVAIFPDNDDPGRIHAQDIARNLHGKASVVKVVELPGLSEKGDISDWIAAGGTWEQLSELVKAAPEWTPETAPPFPQTETKEEAPKKKAGKEKKFVFTDGHNLTDLGNARRLVALHGTNIRYCYPWGKWLVWDGRRWARDETGKLERLAKETVKSIYAEAAEIADEKYRQAVAQHALRTESEGRRKAMIASAMSEPGVPILPEHLDRDPWLFNVLNGTLDLKTGKLRPHDRTDLLTKTASVDRDPIATCPNFLAFLERILPGPIISFLQKALGYSMTGITREQVLFFLYGLGANGKSTLLEVIQALLGDYATQTSSDTFLVKPRGGAIPNDLAALKGARFVAAAEVEAGRRMAEVLIKQLTGGDKITARFLHGEFFEFKPTFKLWLSANHKPVIRGTDHAIWRRIRLLPFTVQIPKEEQDRELPEKLKAELPGILNWALAGCLQWQYGGLEPPEEVTSATQTYREEMDVMADFLAERCFLAPGASATAEELYSTYTKWSEDAGEKRPMSQRSFGMALTERGFQRRRGTGGRMVWDEIGVKSE